MYTMKPVFIFILCILSCFLQKPEQAIAQTIPAFTGDNCYCLYNTEFGTCITAGGEEDGVPRQIHPNVRLPIPFPQLWGIHPRKNGHVIFKSKTNELCIDYDMSAIIHKNESGEQSQEWIIEPADNGSFRIIWAKYKALCLDIDPKINPPQGKLIAAPKSDKQSQLWRIKCLATEHQMYIWNDFFQKKIIRGHQLLHQEKRDEAVELVVNGINSASKELDVFDPMLIFMKSQSIGLLKFLRAFDQGKKHAEDVLYYIREEIEKKKSFSFIVPVVKPIILIEYADISGQTGLYRDAEKYSLEALDVLEELEKTGFRFYKEQAHMMRLRVYPSLAFGKAEQGEFEESCTLFEQAFHYYSSHEIDEFHGNEWDSFVERFLDLLQRNNRDREIEKIMSILAS